MNMIAVADDSVCSPATPQVVALLAELLPLLFLGITHYLFRAMGSFSLLLLSSAVGLVSRRF